MPKEIIQSKHYNPERLDNEPWEPFVKVGWGKEQEYVEVAVLHHGEATADSPAAESGWFAQLDRTGINRLIRTLRQARDQAYGRDE